MAATPDLQTLRRELDGMAAELGFTAVGVAAISLAEDEAHLRRWLDAGRHGDMHYMARHGVAHGPPTSSPARCG
jgi:epoxyqueuosine reductase